MTNSTAWLRFWAFIRIAAAMLGSGAIVAQLQQSVANALSASTPHGSDVPTVIANFFSFFTIQSNVLAVVILIIGGAYLLTRARDDIEEPTWFGVALASVSTYMIVTGIVYNTLLRGVALPQGTTVPWSNEVLHVVIPIVLLLDVFLAPRRRALSWRTAWIIVIYPIVWVVYTLVRAPLITAPATGDPYWYPYPFLNPNNFDNGYGTVAVYIVGIAVAIIAVALFVIWVGHSRVAKRVDALVPDAGAGPDQGNQA